MTVEKNRPGPKWQLWVGIFVVLGIVATVAYAFGETFFG